MSCFLPHCPPLSLPEAHAGMQVLESKPTDQDPSTTAGWKQADKYYPPRPAPVTQPNMPRCLLHGSSEGPRGTEPHSQRQGHSRAHPVFTGFPVFPPWESLSQLNHLHTGPRQALLSAEAPIRALPGAQHQGSWGSSLLPLLFPQDSRVLL